MFFVKDKVKNIMADVFMIPVESIPDDASPDSVGAWDSVNHMNLVVALEEAFDVQFSEIQIIEMLNIDLVVLSLQELQDA